MRKFLCLIQNESLFQRESHSQGQSLRDWTLPIFSFFAMSKRLDISGISGSSSTEPSAATARRSSAHRLPSVVHGGGVSVSSSGGAGSGGSGAGNASGSGSGSGLRLADIDAPDYERLLQSRQADIAADPLSHLLLVPEDDLQVSAPAPGRPSLCS